MARKTPPILKRDVRRIQESFRLVSAQPERMAQRFYAHLFRLDPTLRRLFHGGMREQGQKLVDMLALVAARIDRIDDLLPTIRELGVRHVGYQVEEAHYATAGEALQEALAEVMGPEFDPDTRQAWARAYDLLATTMIDAARKATAAAENIG